MTLENQYISRKMISTNSKNRVFEPNNIWQSYTNSLKTIILNPTLVSQIGSYLLHVDFTSDVDIGGICEEFWVDVKCKAPYLSTSL